MHANSKRTLGIGKSYLPRPILPVTKEKTQHQPDRAPVSTYSFPFKSVKADVDFLE